MSPPQADREEPQRCPPLRLHHHRPTARHRHGRVRLRKDHRRRRARPAARRARSPTPTTSTPPPTSPRCRRAPRSTTLDRLPWLQTIGAAGWPSTPPPARSSAARRSSAGTATSCARPHPTQVFVHLDGRPEVVARRVAGRPGHFMPASLVDSQFATLERLQPDEAGFALDLDLPVDDRSSAARAHRPRLARPPRAPARSPATAGKEACIHATTASCSPRPRPRRRPRVPASSWPRWSASR